MVSKIDDQQLEDGLYKKERDLTLRLSTLDAILIAFFLQVISGPIFTKFWLKAGADQTTIGVVTSLLWGMQIFSPLTSTLAHFLKVESFWPDLQQ